MMKEKELNVIKKSIVNNQHFWIRMTSDKSDCMGVNTYHITDYSV